MLMDTQTLEARQTGAGEQRGPSVEMPEPTNPCKKLGRSLLDYQSALAQSEECAGRVAKAQSDLDTLGDSSLSEEESLKAISDANGRKALYASRAVPLERKVESRLAELRDALMAAMREQTNQVSLMIDRERESIIKAVYAALGVENAPSIRGEVIRITRVSPVIMSLESLSLGNVYQVKNLASSLF